MSARERLADYAAEELTWCHGENMREDDAPAAFDALRKILLMAHVIRTGGPIDGAVVAGEIDRLIVSALDAA